MICQKENDFIMERNISILKTELQDLLELQIDLSKYPRTTIEITFEIIEYNCQLMSALTNIVCLLLSINHVNIYDYFTSAFCVIQDGRTILQPDQVQIDKSQASLLLVMSDNRIIHMKGKGQMDNENLEKLISLGKSSCAKVLRKLKDIVNEY